MRGVALLVLACACDQVFGIQHTHSNDAPFFDAPTDAPFACPMLGTTPMYSPYVHLVSADDCFEYTPSFTSGRVVASGCNDSGYPIYEGPFEGPLEPAIPAEAATVELTHPRLTPDGTQMYVWRDVANVPSNILAFTRASDGTWQTTSAPGFPIDATPSNIIRGPSDDRMLLVPSAGSELDEWSDAGGTWHQLAVHPVSELGVTFVSASSLSSDGLRLIVLADSSFGFSMSVYSDRMNIDGPFRAAELLTGVPTDEHDAVISDDCARIYLSGLGALFYVRQL